MEPTAAAPHTWTFLPASKVSCTSYRTVSVRDTLERVRACAKHVPITRVADHTPLDRLRLPVFSATTPLARDLTTHMGKGVDREAAQASAMMESIERISAERVVREARVAPFNRLRADGLNVMDPAAFDLPPDTKYTPDSPVSWVEAWDLIHEQAVWVPTDVVVTPPREGVLTRVDTNGLAAGNTMLEAILHGVCEVIERDALGIHLFQAQFAGSGARRPLQRVELDSLSAVGQHWVERILESGLRIETVRLNSDTGVPVFRTLIFDDDYPSATRMRRRAFIGLGCSPDAGIAVLRSVTEAVQSRVAIVAGARDSFNAVPVHPRGSLAPVQAETAPVPTRVSSLPSFSTSDLREDLYFLLNRLRSAGMSTVIAVDLTRREFGVPVVRIRIPGMTSFAVDSTRAGWSCLRCLL